MESVAGPKFSRVAIVVILGVGCGGQTGGGSAGTGGGRSRDAGRDSVGENSTDASSNGGARGGVGGSATGGGAGGAAGAGAAAGKGGALGAVGGGAGGIGGGSPGAAGAGAAGTAGGGASGAAGTNTGWTGMFNPILYPWPPAAPFPWLVYDSGRGAVILFGGNPRTDVPLDVWDLDVTTWKWTNRQPTPAPSLNMWPISRSIFEAAYDPVYARTFLFGGYDLIYYADLWAWDGVGGTWTNLTPKTLPAANWPGARAGHGLVFDSDRDKLVLFGGSGGSTLLNDLWECDPVTGTWTNRTPNPLPAVWPGPRQILGMVYDQSRKRVVLFGGDEAPPDGSTTSPVAELWEWDGAGGIWTNRTPATLPVAGWPSARSDPAMVYDAPRARTLFFGDQTISQEFWEWNGSAGTWIDRTPNPIPTVGWPTRRADTAMTIVPGPDLLLLFGGQGYPNGGKGALGDLWYWKMPGP